MGLTSHSTGHHAMDGDEFVKKQHETDKIIALAGNPNVGKSTVFNALTGGRQHTGNWPGKTVSSAHGVCHFRETDYLIVDLPGSYSLDAHSAEEEITRDYILSGVADAAVIVCDATCLERNLILALQIIRCQPASVLCVNLMDEAEKKGILVNLKLLSERLHVPVVGTSARSRKGLTELLEAVEAVCALPVPGTGSEPDADKAAQPPLAELAHTLCDGVLTYTKPDYDRSIRNADRLLTSRWFGFPLMFLLLLCIFWLTITGANAPSELLADALFGLEDILYDLLTRLPLPTVLAELLVHGSYRTLAWVVSVMLPPMAIFFPLFTLLEDSGYLPRIAFNMDACFKKCRACGKQALTMCMGFGCNAAGVIGCRIIDSPRERLIAILTNAFVPCNGRFPTLIALISMFFITGAVGWYSSLQAAFLLALVILLGILATMLVSYLLSVTILKGMPSSFLLELPPYRRPQIGKVLVRSVFDRTLFVLGRAVTVAAPAGLLLWVLANVSVGGSPLLATLAELLHPFAVLMGLDGVILLAFLLGFPANEIVVPIMIMCYLSSGTLTEYESLAELKLLFLQNGWTLKTAVCTMLFMLFHFPCSTTCITIYKETKKLRYTLLAILLPTVVGMLCCMFVNLVWR
ncbi:MAG: ferrous iron transporter B [Lachnospiraceae bacterium]